MAAQVTLVVMFNRWFAAVLAICVAKACGLDMRPR